MKPRKVMLHFNRLKIYFLSLSRKTIYGLLILCGIIIVGLITFQSQKTESEKCLLYSNQIAETFRSASKIKNQENLSFKDLKLSSDLFDAATSKLLKRKSSFSKCDSPISMLSRYEDEIKYLNKKIEFERQHYLSFQESERLRSSLGKNLISNDKELLTSTRGILKNILSKIKSVPTESLSRNSSLINLELQCQKELRDVEVKISEMSIAPASQKTKR